MTSQTTKIKTEQIQAIIEGLGTAYWHLNYSTFCQICGFDEDFYSAEKWQQWQGLHQYLSKFDCQTLTRLANSQR